MDSSTVATTPQGVRTALLLGATKVLVDSSLAAGGIAHVTSGVTWPMAGVELLSFNSQSFLSSSADKLTVDVGATLENWVDVQDGLILTLNNGVLSYTTVAPSIRIDRSVVQMAAGSTVTGATLPTGSQVILLFSANLNGVAGAPVFTVATGGTLALLGFGDAVPNADAIGGPVGSTLFNVFDASSPPPNFTLFLGTNSPFQLDNSLNMLFTPSVSANWSSVNPTSVKNALDRIAAHVGPIP